MSCELVLGLLLSERILRAEINRVMGGLGLSEQKFEVLLALFALDPLCPSAAELSYHSQVNRSALAEILSLFGERKWVERMQENFDKHPAQIKLTEKGREVAGEAIKQFLDTAKRLTQDLPISLRPTVLTAFSKITKRAGSIEP